MSNEICGLCRHVQTDPTGECYCCQDLQETKFHDEKECFDSRADFFDGEHLIDFDD